MRDLGKSARGVKWSGQKGFEMRPLQLFRWSFAGQNSLYNAERLVRTESCSSLKTSRLM